MRAESSTGYVPAHAAPASSAPPVAPATPAPTATLLPPHPILDGPLPAQATARPAAAPAEVADRPVMTAADVETGTKGWPCVLCGDVVGFDLQECPRCGQPFLADAKGAISLVLPGIGDVTRLSTGGRFALMAGGALLVTAVLVLIFLVGGTLL